VIAAGLGVAVRPSPGPSPAAAPVTDSASASLTPFDSADPVAGADASWMLMEMLSDEVAFDEVAGSGALASPGSADRALQQLSRAERAQLMAILRKEMARPVGSDPGPEGH
jgi:hypothetical protein